MKSISLNCIQSSIVFLFLFYNLLLKLEVVSLLEISGLKEFQFVTVRGKKLYLNTSDLTGVGMKW